MRVFTSFHQLDSEARCSTHKTTLRAWESSWPIYFWLMETEITKTEGGTNQPNAGFYWLCCGVRDSCMLPVDSQTGFGRLQIDHLKRCLFCKKHGCRQQQISSRGSAYEGVCGSTNVSSYWGSLTKTLGSVIYCTLGPVSRSHLTRSHCQCHWPTRDWEWLWVSQWVTHRQVQSWDWEWLNDSLTDCLSPRQSNQRPLPVLGPLPVTPSISTLTQSVTEWVIHWMIHYSIQSQGAKSIIDLFFHLLKRSSDTLTD